MAISHKIEWRDEHGRAIYHYSHGNLRFALFDGKDEICLCGTLELAKRVMWQWIKEEAKGA